MKYLFTSRFHNSTKAKRHFTLINLMFICIYMNILIYNQERKECTMQKKKKNTKTFIYRSINKDIIKDSLYSTWVFAYLGKWGKKRLKL